MLPSYRPHQRTIAVGNLELGGTGKTPMIDHLVILLGENTTATLSRGYGRKTRGTWIVEPDMTARQCGDEPLLLKKRHPNLLVIVVKGALPVCEEEVEMRPNPAVLKGIIEQHHLHLGVVST
jgi:tetraacyldisaccharide 4'-kinase